jgi:hypothetical protein
MVWPYHFLRSVRVGFSPKWCSLFVVLICKTNFRTAFSWCIQAKGIGLGFPTTKRFLHFRWWPFSFAFVSFWLDSEARFVIFKFLGSFFAHGRLRCINWNSRVVFQLRILKFQFEFGAWTFSGVWGAESHWRLCRRLRQLKSSVS